MRTSGCALLLSVIMTLFSYQIRAQTAVDVKSFDLAGIKLRAPISDVAAIFRRLRERDGGEILGQDELEKALNDYQTLKGARYFGYSSEFYKIGVTLSPPYQVDGKTYPPSVIDVIYVIKNYGKDTGAREQVLEKYGAPTFENKTNGDLKYCQRLIGSTDNNFGKECDVEHGDALSFVNGTLYLSDKVFEALTEAHRLP